MIILKLLLIFLLKGEKIMKDLIYTQITYILEHIGARQVVMSCTGVLFETKVPNELKSED